MLDDLPRGRSIRHISDRWLNLYCHRMPLVLLASLDDLPALDDYPRADGPPSVQQIASVLHWGLVASCWADGAVWLALYLWSLTELYPEFYRRHDRPHPCEERVLWIGQQPRLALPAVDVGSIRFVRDVVSRAA
ncbi:MAG: hypothetical protein AAFR76_01395 [Planctomycetota bacterium]